MLKKMKVAFHLNSHNFIFQVFNQFLNFHRTKFLHATFLFPCLAFLRYLFALQPYNRLALDIFDISSMLAFFES